MSDLEQDDYVYPGKRFGKTGVVLGEGQGMTLRDWFAGQVIMGICANPNCNPREDLAGAAYEQADAMLAARKDTE